jgi:molybdenum cofactor cytidylyltransferase
MALMHIGDVGMLIMAAGSSKRFGRPKQLEVFKGRSLVRRSVETAIDAGLKHLICVTGREYELIKAELRDLPCRIIFNQEYQAGIGASIRHGFQSLLIDQPTLGAVMIMHADQPLIRSGLLTKMIETYEPSRSMIVAASYAGTFGVPVLIDRIYFPAFMKLEGDEGGKKILLKHARHIVGIPFPEGAQDIDTREDLENL